MNVSIKKSMVMTERLLRYRSLNGLFKHLTNLCKLLMTDQFFDNCYCNLTFQQCWLCNLSDFVRNNKIKDNLKRYEKQEDNLIDIAYKFLFYIKKIRKEHHLNYNDKKYVLNFFR